MDIHRILNIRLVVLILCIGLITIAGCKKDTVPDQLHGHLTVNYYDSTAFYTNYGNLLSLKFPDVTFEVIESSTLEIQTTEQLVEALHESKPDLLITNYLMYTLMVNRDLLYDLNPLIQRKKYDLKVAMTSARFDYIDQLQQKNVDFEWSIVTDVVNSDNRNLSFYTKPNEMVSIHAQSSNVDLAWEVLAFLNSNEIARVQYRSLPTRADISKERNGVSLEPFYQLRPDTWYQTLVDYPKERESIFIPFETELRQIIERHVEAIVERKQTIEEALEQIQKEGQETLNRLGG